MLHHRQDGDGPRILLLHPVGLDLTFFDPLVSELRDRYTLLRLDTSGHGRSPMTPEIADLRTYASEIHATVSALGWSPAAVVGFSFGGMLAQTLAIEYADDVSAVVIGACASTFPDEVRESLAERGRRALRDGMAAVVDTTLERWFSDAFRRTEAIEPARRQLLAADVREWARAWDAIAGVDTAPRLSTIRVPALCLAGEHDRSAPPTVVEAIARAIPSARFTVVAGASHMMFIERPREVAAALDDFFESIGYASQRKDGTC